LIPGRQRTQIEHLRVNVRVVRGLQAPLDHGSPGDDRDLGARSHRACLAEGYDELVPRIWPPRPGAIEHRAMLEEDDRIVAPQRWAQQSSRVLGVRGDRNLPADAVYPGNLVGLAVPGITALEEAPGHAHDERCCEAIAGAPAQRPAIVQLLGGGIRVLAELD